MNHDVDAAPADCGPKKGNASRQCRTRLESSPDLRVPHFGIRMLCAKFGPTFIPQKMKRILILDDDKGFLETLTELLTLEGFSVRAYSSMPDIETLHEAGLPDLILCDLVLPGCTGFDLLKGLKSSESLERIPVVMLSAQVDLPTREEAFRLGCADYITKPATAAFIVSKIGELTKSHPSQHFHFRYQERQKA